MYTHSELMEVLGEAELAYVSHIFWTTRTSSGELLPKNISDHPDHPVWKELLAFQNGWLKCKQDYKIND